jgi:hypothetical protein
VDRWEWLWWPRRGGVAAAAQRPPHSPRVLRVGIAAQCCLTVVAVVLLVAHTDLLMIIAGVFMFIGGSLSVAQHVMVYRYRARAQGSNANTVQLEFH